MFFISSIEDFGVKKSKKDCPRFVLIYLIHNYVYLLEHFQLYSIMKAQYLYFLYNQ